MIKVGVIDAGIGNFPSLVGAFLRADVEATVIRDPDHLERFEFAVLPGVGHWSQASQRLLDSGWSESVISFTSNGGRLLGICLGMQLLGTFSEEGDGPGLGLIDMHTAINPSLNGRTENIGWNRVMGVNGHENWFGVQDGRSFYFTHKYSVSFSNSPPSVLKSVDFTGLIAAVQLGNVIGVQFHPERSGKSGIDFLSHVARWATR